MEDKRFFVIAPYTVQIAKLTPTLAENGEVGLPEVTIKNVRMESGRMLAQAVHVGRKIENDRYRKALLYGGELPYEEITTITLGVRNSKELRKVSAEIVALAKDKILSFDVSYEEFHDTNPAVYDTYEKVHTITIVGPIEKSVIDSAIGHLELY